MKRGCLLILFMLPWGVGAAEEIYKWYDEQGNPHFSNKAPADVEVEEISVDTKKTGVKFATPEQVEALKGDIKASKKEEAQEEKQKQKYANERRKKCNKLRDKLSATETYLESVDNQLDRRKADNLRKLIKKDCGRI